jgi:hypothetical protein
MTPRPAARCGRSLGEGTSAGGAWALALGLLNYPGVPWDPFTPLSVRIDPWTLSRPTKTH